MQPISAPSLGPGASRRPLAQEEVTEYRQRFQHSRRFLEFQDQQPEDADRRPGQVKTPLMEGSFGADGFEIRQYYLHEKLNHWRDVAKQVRTSSSLQCQGDTAAFVERREISWPSSGNRLVRATVIYLSQSGSYLEITREG
ncbi:MAG: hypothetical protein HY319_32555 [Armatimonadetes bacterium]|nr:hypothetical protein [Armatimonadota bacterium]